MGKLGLVDFDLHQHLVTLKGPTLSLALRHPRWGALALPLRAMLYVRRKTLGSIPRERGWSFATKLELAARLADSNPGS